MSKFARRLDLALQMNNMRSVDLCKKTGLSSATISQYKTGYCAPRMDRVKLIAEALNVSAGWLIGYDTPIQSDADDAISVFGSLSAENKLKAIDYMHYLKSKEPRNEEE